MNIIERTIQNYLKAYIKLKSLIQDKTKGDWNKATMLINNDSKALEAYNDLESAINKFRKLTSEVDFVQISPEFHSFYDHIKDLSAVQKSPTPIACFLEHYRDEWECKIEEGHIPDEDGSLIDALDAFFNLPNYDPDGWLQRKFMLGGLLLVNDATKISKKTKIAFKEACIAFIYGLPLAAISVGRSALESSLRECFPKYSNENLGWFVNRGWSEIDKLQQNNDLNEKARKIMRSGNQALHQVKEGKINYLLTELFARTILMDLRDILEFLYR